MHIRAVRASRYKEIDLTKRKSRHFWKDVVRFRDRESPSSNPGPPTSSDFKGAFLGSSGLPDHGPGHTFVGKPSQMGRDVELTE